MVINPQQGPPATIGQLRFVNCGNIPAFRTIFPADFLWHFCVFIAHLQWHDQQAQHGSGTPLVLLCLLFYLQTGCTMPIRDRTTWHWRTRSDQSIRRQACTLLIVLRTLSETLGREIVPGLRSFFKKVRPVHPLDDEIKWAIVPYHLEKSCFDKALTLACELHAKQLLWTAKGLPARQVTLSGHFAPAKPEVPILRPDFCDAEWCQTAAPPPREALVRAFFRGGRR